MSEARGVPLPARPVPSPADAPRPSRMTELGKRVLSTIVLLPVFVWIVVGGPARWQRVAVTLLGVCYVNWLLGHAISLRALPDGVHWILLLVWVTWIGETAAYLVGSLAGRHKLAPGISPGKTVEGAIAQLVASVLAALVAGRWLFPGLQLRDAVAVGILLGVLGQVGDLVESALKRSVGVKDAGNVIPGHGGILDRIDGLLFNVPVLFYYVTYGRTWSA